MHENQEISNTPSSADEGRSAKAINHNADMHVLEKSDCAVLPVNQPNKEGQPSAEAGEGRAQMKENIDQSHMLPTQSGKRMSQGLGGVRKAAMERKQERFTSLLHHLSVDILRDSFYALQRKASPGVDGMTWQEYESGLEDRLIDLHSRVHRGTYRAQPSRRVYIPKAEPRPAAREKPNDNCKNKSKGKDKSDKDAGQRTPGGVATRNPGASHDGASPKESLQKHETLRRPAL